MTERRRYEILPGSHGGKIKVNVRGSEVLRIPRLNRGTAFTHAERDRLGLVGLLPTGVTTLEGQLYYAFVERFVTVASDVFPHAMIHWEDFGAGNAHELLQRYRERIPKFNDDIQGTAAVVGAAALAAVRSQDGRLRDQRIVIHGAGTAVVGIADLLRDMMVAEGATPDEARACIWGLNSRARGRGRPGHPSVPTALRRKADEVAGWQLRASGRITLADDDPLRASVPAAGRCPLVDPPVAEPRAVPGQRLDGWRGSAGGRLDDLVLAAG